MKEFPIILDNIIDEDYQNKIEDSLFDCNWKLNIDNCMMSNEKDRKFLNPKHFDISPIISTNIIEKKEIFFLLSPLIEKSCTAIEFKLKKIIRCFSGIHLSLNQNSKIDKVHINRKTPHIVMLYYVTDSDGETILYNKKNNDLKKDFYIPYEIQDLQITHKISPQKGRVLFFDGDTYHSSSTPSSGFRVIITLDLCGEFGNKIYNHEETTNIQKNFFNYT